MRDHQNDANPRALFNRVWPIYICGETHQNQCAPLPYIILVYVEKVSTMWMKWNPNRQANKCAELYIVDM